MPERITHKYLRLCEVRMLHHYWLDQGATVFDALPANVQQQRLLTSYDARTFLSVEPTPGTAALIAGINGVFKTTALGFVVAAPEDTVLNSSAIFEFVIRITSRDFFNYTALTMRGQEISQHYHEPTERMYRYKSGVYVWSNVTGSQQNGIRFLSRIMEAAAPAPYPAESLMPHAGGLHQAVRDTNAVPSAPDWQNLGTAASHPRYVHQGDVPPPTPPAGLAGVPPPGIELSDGIPDDIFALVRIVPLNLGNGMGLLSAPNVMSEPVFELRFKNRSTHRMYFNRSTGAHRNDIAEQLLPLTYYGNAGGHQKPEPGQVKPVLDASGNITRINSEIFI